MSVYTLTYTEAWALALLLHLPVQPGSALADWLTNDVSPDLDQLPGTALDTLAKKGYYRGPQAAEPFSQGLLRALSLASVNAATLTTLIRVNHNACLVRYAQAGEHMVQFGNDEGGLSLHDVTPMSQVARTLLPRWFSVGINEDLRDDLPLGAFVLFNHACTLADLALGRSELASEAFSAAELHASFQRGTAWLDLFSAVGIEGVQPRAKLPVDDYIGMLITRGYLMPSGQNLLGLGTRGRPLAETLSASGRCTLTMTLHVWDAPVPLCDVLLYGNRRLFLLEYAAGQVHIQQMDRLDRGDAWVAAMLDQGRQAHYNEYRLPQGTSVPLDHKTPALRSPAIPAPAPPPAIPAPAPAPPTVIPAPAQPTAICAQCGNPVQVGMRFCAHCGTPYVLPSAAPTIILAPASLILLSAVQAPQRFALGEQLRLGREEDNDVRLSDQMASRHHAMIQRQGDQYLLSDLGSGNGTVLNGVRVAGPTVLAEGDIILIGQTQLKFSRRT